MVQIFTYFSIATGFFAAGLWFWAATTRILPRQEPDKDGWMPAAILVDEKGKKFDLVSTVLRSSRLNAYAAIVTAISLGFATVAEVCEATARIVSQ